MDLQIKFQDLINKIITDNNKKYSTLLFNIVFYVLRIGDWAQSPNPIPSSSITINNIINQI